MYEREREGEREREWKRESVCVSAESEKISAPSFYSIMIRKHFATSSSHEGLMEELTMKWGVKKFETIGWDRVKFGKNRDKEGRQNVKETKRKRGENVRKAEKGDKR